MPFRFLVRSGFAEGPSGGRLHRGEWRVLQVVPVVGQVAALVAYGEVGDRILAVGQLHGVPVVERRVLRLVPRDRAVGPEDDGLGDLAAPAFDQRDAEVAAGGRATRDAVGA